MHKTLIYKFIIYVLHKNGIKIQKLCLKREEDYIKTN